MLRNHWEFEYTCTTLAEAAKLKIAFHQERLQWWKEKRTSIMAEIRADGLEINEKVVLSYRSPKSRDWDDGSQIMIRNDLQKALGECHEKLAYHTERLSDFLGWHEMLSANPHTRKQLDIQDWLFFFSKDVSQEKSILEQSNGY